MVKVITVRTLGEIEYNAIYEPTGVLLPEGVTKNSYFEVLVTGKNGSQLVKTNSVIINQT